MGGGGDLMGAKQRRGGQKFGQGGGVTQKKGKKGGLGRKKMGGVEDWTPELGGPDPPFLPTQLPFQMRSLQTNI